MKITCPLYIDLTRKTKKDRRVYINMNSYRNLHYLVSNSVKRAYKEALREQLEGVTIETPVDVTYQVFKGSKRRLDKMNVIAVTSKFLLDAITEYGCWEDDKDDYVKTETLLPTQYDKENPRVEVVITSVNKFTW